MPTDAHSEEMFSEDPLSMRDYTREELEKIATRAANCCSIWIGLIYHDPEARHDER